MTSNFAGQRLPKTNEIFEALGSNDELNSCIGYVSPNVLSWSRKETWSGRIVVSRPLNFYSFTSFPFPT